MGQAEEVATDSQADLGMSWVSLLKWSAIASVVVVALINVFAGIIPPLIVFALIWIASVIWLRKSQKGPAILLLVSFIAFFALSAPFVVPTLTAPASAGDFILNLASVVAGLAGVTAAIAVLRGLGSTGGARKIAVAGAVLFVVGTAFSVYATVTYEDAVAQAGDIEVVTQDIVFKDDSLEVEAGEISVLVDNKDATLHTFTIDELEVDLDIPASKTARVTFQAEPGTYEFYCAPHTPGMAGTLEVK
ncbi:MAG TPA: cupredoxin domain-containing protein [Actinomycetota bacterium]|nr:cupredoxin domain-containing protein [Actinomycetota bacterium]